MQKRDYQIEQEARLKEKFLEEVRRILQDRGQIVDTRERSWSSITFAGTRVQLDLQFDGESNCKYGFKLLAELPEVMMFVLPGRLVTDVCIVSNSIQNNTESDTLKYTVEILLLDDWD